jgi:DNA polymerase III epsilon subunit-like protein
MIYLLFDTETTGIPKHPSSKPEVQPRLIEFGGVLVESSGEVLEEIHCLINPEEKLEQIITKITGLTDEDLKSRWTFPEACKSILPAFKQADVLVAHNLPFDLTMMELEVERAGITDWVWPKERICTVQEHAEEWGTFPRLLHLYEHYMGHPLEQTHRALDDVYALLEVAKASGVLI